MDLKLGKLRVGIQGIRASFHDVVARQYFEGAEIEVVECQSFRQLVETLSKGEVDRCVMAIENSLAGSILTNYQLLEHFDCRIMGEMYLRIELNLMALPGQKIEDLRYVQSHPMALLQCEDFLAQHPSLEVSEAADTAECARRIFDRQLFGYGAIAGRLAGEVFKLELLATGIETNKLNYTRFLIVSRQRDRSPMISLANKASLRFETPHQQGSLLEVLTCFNEHGLNMTKLQSVPIAGRPYEYAFHVDLEWRELSEYQKAIVELKERTINLIQFGEYIKSERPWL